MQWVGMHSSLSSVTRKMGPCASENRLSGFVVSDSMEEERGKPRGLASAV